MESATAVPHVPAHLDPGVVQPGHRPAGRLGADDRAGGSAGRGRRRGADPARLGRAAGEDARRLHEAGRRGAARRHRRDRQAAERRAGQAADRVLHDGAAADGRRAALVREGGAEDPRRREGADDPGLHALQERPLQLRADRRRRRDRALELPLVDPLRRGRDRADGGQRRGAEAGQPDAAARRADPRRLREGRPARGPGPGRPRRRPDRRRALPLQRRQGLLHRLGRGRPQGRRGLRRRPEGLGPGARRQGPDDRLLRRRPRQRGLRRSLGRLRQRRPDLLGDRARLRDARRRRPLHRGRRPRDAKSSRSATSSTGTPRSAR